MVASLAILGIILILFIYWREWYFFRDPEREIPSGSNVVSPADGTVVYVKKLAGDVVPISVKAKSSIKLDEISKIGLPDGEKLIIGIFMHPTSVHVNRAPIAGRVKRIIYTKGRNLPMTMMWWRVLLGLRPYEKLSSHIITNSRNTVLFEGDSIFACTIQIADIYVSKIECWVKENEQLVKGDRIGRIVFGSQVDIILPAEKVSVLVAEGQTVLAGHTAIAEY